LASAKTTKGAAIVKAATNVERPAFFSPSIPGFRGVLAKEADIKEKDKHYCNLSTI
jgi:hypothetical protein